MKRAVIVVLVALNMALLGTLLVKSTATPAQAQAYYSTNYMMINAAFDNGRHGVFIVDLNTNRMVAVRLDPKTSRVIAFQTVRDLVSDFQAGLPALPARTGGRARY